MTVPIDDHPFFTPMPVWGLPGLMTAAAPTTVFPEYKAHVFYWLPPNIRKTLGLADGEIAQLPFPEFRINHEKYARAIAKIAYCQAVVWYGLHGFRRLVLPDIILGRYPLIPYFVGCPLDDTDPPSHPSVKHAIQLSNVASGRLQLILATVRLFSNSEHRHAWAAHVPRNLRRAGATAILICGLVLQFAVRWDTRAEKLRNRAGRFCPTGCAK